MPDFIVIDEMQNYNALLTYFIDLRDNKKESFVYTDIEILQKLAETKFINEKNVQPILFERAYEEKWDIGKIFKNIFREGTHKIDLESVKTFEDLFNIRDAIKYIIVNRKTVLDSIINNKVLFTKMYEGALLEAVKNVSFAKSMQIWLEDYKELFINQNYFKDIMMEDLEWVEYLVDKMDEIIEVDERYRTILFNNVDFRTTVLEKKTINYNNWDYFKEFFEIEHSLTNIGSSTFIKNLNFISCFKLILRPLNCTNKNNLNFKFCGYYNYTPTDAMKVSVNNTISKVSITNPRSSLNYQATGFGNISSVNIPIVNGTKETAIWMMSSNSNSSYELYCAPLRHILPYSISLT